jgi:hypothetical protein
LPTTRPHPNFTRFAVSTRRACLACIKLIEDEFGPLWVKKPNLDSRDCEVSFTPVDRQHQLDPQPSEFPHLLCLSIASSSSSSDRGEMPSA